MHIFNTSTNHACMCYQNKSCKYPTMNSLDFIPTMERTWSQCREPWETGLLGDMAHSTVCSPSSGSGSLF